MPLLSNKTKNNVKPNVLTTYLFKLPNFIVNSLEYAYLYYYTNNLDLCNKILNNLMK